MLPEIVTYSIDGSVLRLNYPEQSREALSEVSQILIREVVEIIDIAEDYKEKQAYNESSGISSQSSVIEKNPDVLPTVEKNNVIDAPFKAEEEGKAEAAEKAETREITEVSTPAGEESEPLIQCEVKELYVESPVPATPTADEGTIKIEKEKKSGALSFDVDITAGVFSSDILSYPKYRFVTVSAYSSLFDVLFAQAGVEAMIGESFSPVLTAMCSTGIIPFNWRFFSLGFYGGIRYTFYMKDAGFIRQFGKVYGMYADLKITENIRIRGVLERHNSENVWSVAALIRL